MTIHNPVEDYINTLANRNH